MDQRKFNRALVAWQEYLASNEFLQKKLSRLREVYRIYHEANPKDAVDFDVFVDAYKKQMLNDNSEDSSGLDKLAGSEDSNPSPDLPQVHP